MSQTTNDTADTYEDSPSIAAAVEHAKEVGESVQPAIEQPPAPEQPIEEQPA